MPFPKTRRCEQCTILTPLESLKLYPTKDGKGYRLLCNECGEQFKRRASLNKGAPSKNATMPQKAEAPKMPAAKEQPKQAPLKEALICLRCNYRFKADLDKAGVSYNLVCPYCGMKDQIRACSSPLV